jgi:alpha-glucosidase
MSNTTTTQKAPNNNWWRGGVLYQIYPRSFRDANGDGCGDLVGITQKLDYVASLGVDGIWLSPIFKSPMKDFGYDVSDYCDIDPSFGTLADFKALVARAHALNLKVVIDQVLSHSSDQHPWFAESRASKDNPRADWYVWADPKPDGNPPNNWLSIFGGSAWQWEPRRRQYFFHNFLASQPDLNFHNPAVQEALLATVKFWLELGVDGFRLDTANFYFHNTNLADNPARPPDPNNHTAPQTNPYMMQWHKYDKCQPENLAFLRKLRALTDQYPNTTMVGEIGADDSLGRMVEYTSGPDKLHMAYSFDLLGPEHSARYLHDVFTRFFALAGDAGWPSWALANHDIMRVATRWGEKHPEVLANAFAMQLTMRGTPCLYQGDELGLPEATVAFEDLQDPYGITMWPEFKGRDGCRTPMPWNATDADMGFGNGAKKPWLPLSEPQRALSVHSQETKPDSMLHFMRGLLRWRKQHAALYGGALTMLPADDRVLAYVRSDANEKLACVFNFSGESATYALPFSAAALTGTGLTGATISGNTVTLAPWAGVVAKAA